MRWCVWYQRQYSPGPTGWGDAILCSCHETLDDAEREAETQRLSLQKRHPDWHGWFWVTASEVWPPEYPPCGP